MGTAKPLATRITVIEVHQNIEQHLINITEDRLRLILKDHLETMHSKGSWIAPLGLVLSIGATFCTAKFEKTLGLEPAFWSAVFAIALMLSTGWLVVTLRRAWVSVSVDRFIDRVKGMP